jgi:hypothetical protein
MLYRPSLPQERNCIFCFKYVNRLTCKLKLTRGCFIKFYLLIFVYCSAVSSGFSCFHTDKLEWFYLHLCGSTKYRGSSALRAFLQALRWQPCYWTYLARVGNISKGNTTSYSEVLLRYPGLIQRFTTGPMMEKTRGKCGRRSPTVGFPVPSERTPSSGKTKRKGKDQMRFQDKDEEP